MAFLLDVIVAYLKPASDKDKCVSAPFFFGYLAAKEKKSHGWGSETRFAVSGGLPLRGAWGKMLSGATVY